MSDAPRTDTGSPWECTFEATRRRQLTVGLEVTPEKRLAWLEEMLELARRSGAVPGKRPDPTGK